VDLVSFERRPVPPDTFAVWAGYKKIRLSPDCDASIEGWGKPP
jgi:hypothetical protein